MSLLPPSPPQRLASGLDRVLQTTSAHALSGAGRELLGLLMPSTCVVCARQDGTVCRDCAPGLVAELLHPFRAERDAAALPLMARAAGAGAEPVPALRPVPVVAAARYGGDAARALLAFKDHGRTPAARYLRPAVRRALAAAPDLLSDASAPAEAVRVGVPGSFTLVPVPGSASGFRRRGYDPVEELLIGPLPPGWELARGLLRHRRIPLRSALRPGTSHTGTGSTQRRHRNADRFRAVPRAHGLQGRKVVVFDDVMTTGSTLAAAWRALHQAGIRPVGAVVLAAVTAPGTAVAEGLNSA